MNQEEFKIVVKSEVDKAISNNEKLNNSIEELNKTIKQATGVLNGTVPAFDKMSTSAGHATGSADDFALSLIGSAGIAIAAAAATKVIMGLAFSGLELQDVLQGTTIALSDVEKAQQEFNAAMAAGSVHGAAEVNTLKSLLEIAKDELRTNQQRAEAIKVINQKYPEYLKHLSDEKLNTDDANTAIAKQIELILLRSQIQAAQKAYEKALSSQAEAAYQVEAKKIEAQKEASELASGQSNFLKEQVKLVRDVVNSVKEYGISNKGFSIIDQAQKDLNDANTLVDVFKANLDELLSKASDEGLLEKILGKPGKGEKAAKEIYQAFSDLNTIATQTILTFSQFSHLKGFGIDGLTELNNDVVTQTKTLDTGLTGFQYTAQQRLQGMIKPIQETAKELKIGFGGIASDAIDGLITGFTQQGGGIQDAIKNVVGVLGSFLQNLGKQLIAYSGILTGLQVAIKSLNPTAAAIAGVAALAAGAALKAYATKIPAFATGGITNGPTLALVGDNPGGREAIIPSQDWRAAFNMFSAPNGGYIAETRISGGDLYLLVKQAALEAGRF